MKRSMSPAAAAASVGAASHHSMVSETIPVDAAKRIKCRLGGGDGGGGGGAAVSEGEN